MEGNLAQISLNDILLLATGSKKSGILKLSRGKETVEVFFNEGEIIHATCPIGEGEKALLYPVTWGEGSFNLLPPDGAVAATIHKNSGQILEEVRAMGREWETILEVIPSSKTVFRIADLPEDQNGPITVPHVGWRVLSKIDGRHDVQEIAELLRVPYAYTAKVVFNLYKARLVEIVEPDAKPAGAIVSPGQLVRLGSILMDIIGPIAPMVLRDHIRVLKEHEDSFPEERLDELVGLLSREIADGRMRNKFESQVLQEIANSRKF